MNSIRKLFFTLVLGFFVSTVYGYAVDQDLSKYHALFISKFVDYIDWPNGRANLRIGVVGNSNVLAELKSLLEGKSAEIKKITSSEANTCDVIFIPDNQSSSFQSIDAATRGKTVLIVTENEDLASKGASISFYLEGNKLKYVINKSATSARNIKMSSSLLSLGKVIE